MFESILSSPVVGGLAGGLMSFLGSRSNAREQMDFQRDMSNTSYQRAAVDLEKAGLNRVLALGNGASTPSGAMGSVPDLGATINSANAVATQRKLAESTLNLQQAQTAKELSQTKYTDMQTAYMATQKQIADLDYQNKLGSNVTGKYDAEIREIEQRINNLKTQGSGFQIDNQIKDLQRQRTAIQLERDNVVEPFYKLGNAAMDWVPEIFSGAKDTYFKLHDWLGNKADSAVSSVKDWINLSADERNARELYQKVLDGDLKLSDIKDEDTRIRVSNLFYGKVERK